MPDPSVPLHVASVSSERRTFLRKGDKGELVKELQTLLLRREIPLLVDGIFGDNTVQAVSEFQSRHFDSFRRPLTVDGQVDEATWWSLKHKQNDFIASQFSSAAQLSNANVEGTTQTSHTFHDVITRLDFSDSVQQKVECLRIPLVAFTFHAAVGARRTAASFAAELEHAEPLLSGLKPEQQTLISKMRSNLIIAGPGHAPSTRIEKVIRSWPLFTTYTEESERRCLPPMLLVHLCLDYCQRTRLSVDEAELFSEVIDLATLSAIRKDVQSAFAQLKDDQVSAPDALDRALIAPILEDDPIAVPNARFYSVDSSISIPDELWALLISINSNQAHTTTDIIVPFSVIVSLLSRQLEDFFNDMSSDTKCKPTLQRVMRAIISKKGEWRHRRTGYQAFLPAARLLLSRHRSNFSVAAILYGGATSAHFLPKLDVIDLRPVEWARSAMLVTAELRSAQALYTSASEVLTKSVTPADDSSKPNVAAAGQSLVKATAAWYEAKSKLDVLTRLVESQGYKLLSRESSFDDSPDISSPKKVVTGNFYQLVKQKTVSYQVLVDHSRTEYRQEVRGRMRCFAQPFDFGCRSERYIVKVPYSVSWTTSEKRERTDETFFALEDDLVGKYLGLPLDLTTLQEASPDASVTGRQETLLNNVNAFQIAIGRLPTPITDAKANLHNSDKTVDVFAVQNSNFIDANGKQLEDVLLEIEGMPDREVKLPNNKVVQLPERCFRLLLVPEVECGVSGELTTNRYYAVHNPILQRDNPSAPLLYLVETYRHSLTHEPGHWLGALAYTDSLFPGESRKIKIARQTRMSLQETGTSRSKQSTSRKNVSDVFTQVRSELDDRKQSAASNSWSASVSGGATFGAGSASASASAGGTTSNSSDVLSKSLNDRVDKILTDTSQSNEVEVTSSSSKSTAIDTTSEEEREFSNVNQGQPLTFKFFQLAHLFTATVSLWDIRLVVKIADELIPGVRIPRVNTYRLDQMNEIIPYIDEDDRHDLLEKLELILNSRFGPRTIQLEDGSSSEWIGMIPLKGKYYVEKGNVLSRRSSYVNSGAMFVEAEVGANPGTESYVNDVRTGEIEKARAAVRRVNAEASSIEDGGIVLPSTSEHLTVNLAADSKTPPAFQVGERSGDYASPKGTVSPRPTTQE